MIIDDKIVNLQDTYGFSRGDCTHGCHCGESHRLRLSLDATVETARKGEALRNAKITKMREALVALEWAGGNDDVTGNPTCPDCGGLKWSTGDRSGHSPGCKLEAVLKDGP